MALDGGGPELDEQAERISCNLTDQTPFGASQMSPMGLIEGGFAPCGRSCS